MCSHSGLEIDVISAPNGRAALSLVAVNPPSFVLSDLERPEMNGRELHAQWCKDEKTRDIAKGDLVSELLRLHERLK